MREEDVIIIANGLNQKNILTNLYNLENTQLAFRWGKKSTDNNLTYIGWAVLGSAEGSAVWRIAVIDQTTSTNSSIKWADSNQNYDNIWTNRESLTYG